MCWRGRWSPPWIRPRRTRRRRTSDTSVVKTPACLAYGGYGAGNLKVCGRIGKHKDIRLLLCRTCKKRFSERKGTVFYRSHTPPRKVVSILQHVQDGCGMRQTGRLEKVKEDTVIRYARLAGGHARQ